MFLCQAADWYPHGDGFESLTKWWGMCYIVMKKRRKSSGTKRRRRGKVEVVDENIK